MKKFDIRSLSLKKRILLIALLVLLMCSIVASVTFAWLWSQSDPITNTFTGSNLTISLAEEVGNGRRLVPGDKIAKDPSVTVESGSEPCYLFIHTKGTNGTTYFDITVDSGWNAYPNNDHYYYRTVGDENDPPLEEAETFYILEGESGEDIYGADKSNGFITIKTSLTTTETASTNTTLYFTAVAVQQKYVDLQTAFATAKPLLDN